MHLIQTYGLLLVPALIFVVGGVYIWINVIWGLITGGPRALQEPGAPYLYDRFYYLLYGLGLVGWTWCLLSAANFNNTPPAGFMVGWGVCAIGMGLWFLLRGDMFIRAAQYRAKYGNWLVRLFYQRQNFSRMPPVLRKLFAGAFILIGLGVLAFNLPHVSEAVSDAQTGFTRLIHAVTTS